MSRLLHQTMQIPILQIPKPQINKLSPVNCGKEPKMVFIQWLIGRQSPKSHMIIQEYYDIGFKSCKLTPHLPFRHSQNLYKKYMANRFRGEW